MQSCTLAGLITENGAASPNQVLTHAARAAAEHSVALHESSLWPRAKGRALDQSNGAAACTSSDHNSGEFSYITYKVDCLTLRCLVKPA